VNRFSSVLSRLRRLEPEPVITCPYCKATEAMTEADVNERIKEVVELYEGKIDEFSFPDLPSPHPDCPECRRAAVKFASMTEDELDAKLAALIPYLKDI
jgi:protein-disulfide isomerase